MDTIDIILLLLVLLPGVWQGLKKGFIFQLVTLVVLWAGTWLSYQFCQSLAIKLSQWMHADPAVLKILSFVIIFAVVYLVLYVLGKLLLRVVKLLLGGWVDKLLGFLLAIFKFALIWGLLIVVFNTVNCKVGIVSQSVLDHSGVYSFLRDFAQNVFPYIKGLIMKG